MKKILIDGSFVSKKVTGVQRVNWEVLKQLTLFPDLDIYVGISKDTDDTKLKEINNIKIVKFGKKNNKYWQFILLGRMARKMKARVLCMSNFSPLFKKDYVLLHDVTFLEKEGNNNKLWALKYRFFVGLRFKRHRHVFTVSNFSKNRIQAHYKIKDDKITVCANGADHWDGMVPQKPKNLDIKDYYLSVGSTTPNKNFKYVIALAKANPDKEFLICGRIDENIKAFVGSLKNVHFTGYVTNEELCYLYQNTKGFILPSTYEGFGLPPLEAICCGCRYIAVSNIEVFKEIYTGVANFFDPYDLNNLVNLDNLERISDEARDKIMAKYNWKNTALAIYNVIKED